MSILPIVQLGDAVLRVPTIPVRRFDRPLGRLLDDMIETMHDAPGVGLAANQIGRTERVAVIEVEGRQIELVNPVLVRVDGSQTDLEGCLSLAGYYAPTTRGQRAVVTALDRRGRPIRVSGKGLLARALQHELDHLDGRVYVDRLSTIDALRRAGEPDENTPE
ncbi:MAG: peptide deformylase [Chloroflexi bacterium]|nr:peptide deformylase [Chloroflexota bacterium]